MIRQSRKRKPAAEASQLPVHVPGSAQQPEQQSSQNDDAAQQSLDSFSFADEMNSSISSAPAATRRKIKSDSLLANESQLKLESAVHSSASDSASSCHGGSSRPQQFLIHSQLYTRLLDAQAIHLMRMHYFGSLLRSFRTNVWPTLSIHPPRVATRDEMELFHSRAYIKFIEQICKKYRRNQDSADTKSNYYGTIELSQPLTEEEMADMKKFGLSEETLVFPELWDLFRATIGGTLRAAELLINHHRTNPLSPIVSMNFGGGRHHADCDCARGFCYCNDIVIAILQMQSYFPRILYLDIDLHHGDGVEEAFAASSSVLTCSFHHFAPGFYPTTGPLQSGKKSAINVPLREGIDDATYCALFDVVLNLVLPSFQPNAVVVCAGVDGLAHDRMSPLNLTTHTYAHCIQALKRKLGHFRKQKSKDGDPQPMDAAVVATITASSEMVATSMVISPPSSDMTTLSTEVPAIISSDRATADATSSSTSNDLLTKAEVPTTESSTTMTEVHDPPAVTSADSSSSSSAPPSSSAEWPPSPVPILLLGGGGYKPLDAARAFFIMTAAACNVQLPSKIPETDSYYLEYINSQFSVHTTAKPASACANANDAAYLRSVLAHIKSVCDARKTADKELSSINESADDDFQLNL